MKLYDAAKMPYKGLITKADPRLLAPGYMATAKNIRAESEVIQVRPAITLFKDTGLGVCLGAAALRVNGTDMIFAAYVVSSARRIYHISPVDGTATEVTSASAYGQNTRYGSTTLPVFFEVVKDRIPIPFGAGIGFSPIINGDMEYIVAVQEGHEPLLIAVNSGSYYAWKITDTKNPLTSEATGAALMSTYLAVSGASMPTYTNSGANLVAASNGTSPQNNVRLTITNAVANGDTSIVSPATGSGFDFTQNGQMLFVFETTYEDIWSNLKIEIDNDNAGSPAGNWASIFNGSSENITIIPFNETDKLFALVINVNGSASAPYTSVKHIRFTWSGETRTTGSTWYLDIHAICGVDNCDAVPGETQFAVTYFNSQNRSESYPIVYKPLKGSSISNYGGRPLPNAVIPYNKAIKFRIRLELKRTTTTERDVGVDTFIVYNRLPGERGFYFHKIISDGDVLKIANWTGSAWAYTTSSGAASPQSNYSYSSGRAFAFLAFSDRFRDISIRMPGGNQQCMPKCANIKAIRSRVAVGNINVQRADASSNRRYGDVWISEESMPFRFAPYMRYEKGQFDPYSPVAISLTGETVTAFAKTATNITTADSLWIFTDKNVLVVSGSDSVSLAKPAIVAPHGTLSPKTVQEHKSTIYWLDSSRQVRAIEGGGIRSMSEGAVEDAFSGDLTAACGLVGRDLYRVAYVSGVQTAPQQALVWDSRRNFWVGVDDWTHIGFGVATFVHARSSNNFFVLAFGTDGKIYKIDDTSATKDLTTDSIPITLKSPKIHAGWIGKSMWERVRLGRSGVYCESNANTSLTTTRAQEPGTDTASGIINIGTTTQSAWRYDTPSNGIDAMVSGVVADIQLTGNCLAGTKFYAWDVDVALGTDGADVG